MINECNSANLDREMVFYCASSWTSCVRVARASASQLRKNTSGRGVRSSLFVLRDESGVSDRTDSSLVQVALLSVFCRTFISHQSYRNSKFPTAVPEAFFFFLYFLYFSFFGVRKFISMLNVHLIEYIYMLSREVLLLYSTRIVLVLGLLQFGGRLLGVTQATSNPHQAELFADNPQLRQGWRLNSLSPHPNN